MQKDTYQWLFDGDAVPSGTDQQQWACALAAESLINRLAIVLELSMANALVTPRLV